MAPFEEPRAIIRGLKEKVESFLAEGNKLYVGTVAGSLYIYDLEGSSESSGEASAIESHKPLFSTSKFPKPIEALGYIKDTNSLVVLSDALISLFALPALTAPTQLPQTKGALCFAIHSTVVHLDDSGGEAKEGEKGVPTVVTHLAVGCRRKTIIYSWKDGEALEAKELALSHTPRAIQFFDHRSALLAYTATEHVRLFVPHMSITEVTFPPSASTSTLSTTAAIGGIGKLGIGMGNLGGYLGMGGGTKKPITVRVDTEIAVPRDNQNLLFNSDGVVADGHAVVQWPAQIEDMAFVKPYLISLIPPNTISFPSSRSNSPLAAEASSQAQVTPYLNSCLQIRSTLHPTTNVQTSRLPVASSSPHSSSPTHDLRLLTALPSSVIFTSTPVEKAALTNDGHTVWVMHMKPWVEQIDELVGADHYEDALALLATIDGAVLPDKNERVHRTKTLLAVQKFAAQKFDESLKMFAELDVNPAKVISLYPELISGRLAISEDDWIHAFGGGTKIAKEIPNDGQALSEKVSGGDEGEATLDTINSRKGDDQTTDSQKEEPEHDRNKQQERDALVREQINTKPDERLRRSLEALLEYLPDRRQKVLAITSPPVPHTAATSKGPSKPLFPSASDLPSLSSLPLENLLSLPSVPPSQLNSAQLTTYAQIIDTALFKAYLVVRPSLIGPLCRIGNWCEVKEVESLLRAREKYSDLVHLFNGKRMHNEALALLKELSANEDDMEKKLQPSISYLQKLGPEHLQQVFDFSRWIFDTDKLLAFQIFTSDDVELPRDKVTEFLTSIDPSLAVKYLRFLIDERSEDNPDIHDQLGLLSLQVVRQTEKKGEKEIGSKYQELLTFLDTTNKYRAERLFGALPSDGMFEARAILLGRLGRHESALEVYVHRLKDYVKAEEYCTRIYVPNSRTENIFLSLLRIYLRPTPQSSSLLQSLKPSNASILLQPALDLISRHSPRLDAFSTLDILPPLVTAKDLSQFLIEVLRTPRFDTLVTRELWKARSEEVAYRKSILESQRVTVTDSRICPQCHKRIGTSVIAIHLPRGEVTHYQCREAFSERLRTSSGVRQLPIST